MNIISNKSLLAAVMVVVSAVTAVAQLKVNLNITSRPDPLLANWSTKKNTVICTITNTGTKSVNVKFDCKINRSGALQANTKPEMMRVLAITPGASQFFADDLMPFESMKISGGADVTAVRTGMLPAGIYEFCVSLIDPLTNAQLTAPVCKNFTLVSYQAPVLLQPFDKSQIDNGKRIMFRWTGVSPAPPSPATYRVFVLEVLPGQTPTTAYKVNRPLLDKTVSTTQLLWPADFDLPQAGRQFVWSVQALDGNGKGIGEHNGTATPFTFSTQPAGGTRKMASTDSAGDSSGGNGHNSRHSHAPQNGGNQTTSSTNPVAPPSACSNTSTPPPTITDQNPSSVTAANLVNTFVTVGLFPMKVLTASGSAGALAGTGSIVVSWLHTPIAVEFTALKVNVAAQVYDGDVTSQIDGSPGTYPKKWGLNITANLSWTKALVKLQNTWLHALAPTKMVGNLDLNTLVAQHTNTPLKLPLGLDNLKSYTLMISEMKFNAAGAMLTAQAAFPLPDGNNNDVMGFMATNIPCTPNGPSLAAAKVGLLEDQLITANIPNQDSYEITIKAIDPDSGGTFIEWDCDGFRQLDIDIDVGFPRSWLLPSPDDGSSKAHSKFLANIVDWDDWIINASLDTCTIVNTNGTQLVVTDMSYDHSDTRNPPSLAFPTNYVGSDQDETFHGFFIHAATVELPDKLRSFPNPSQRISIQLSDFIINKDGITGKLEAQNVLNFPNGNISNLGASIDTVKIELVNSSLNNAAMIGKIVLPISNVQSSNAINYQALFNTADGFQFSLSPAGPIIADLWSGAKITLDPASSISIKLDTATKFDMSLTGQFDWANIDIGVVKAITMQMNFEGITMNYNATANTFAFNAGTWSFASPQKKMHKFPVSISNIGYASEPKQPGELIRGGLKFDIIVNLDSNKIGGQTTLEVIGAISKVNGKFVPEYKDVKCKSITIFAHLAAVSLDGTIDIYSGNPEYGTGFSGSIKAVFNSVKMEIDAMLKFGSTNYIPATTSNSGPNYRYWYVEAKLILPPPGIIIFSGFALYGGGLGAWRHMNVSSFPSVTAQVSTASTSTTTTTASTSGATFTPDKSMDFGIKILGVIGTSPTPKTFNADVSISMQFSNGLSTLDFDGLFWAAADLTSRPDAPVWGSVIAHFDIPNKIFALNVNANFVYPKPSGSTIKTSANGVSLKVYVDAKNNKWSFKLGDPANVSTLNTLTVLNAITVQEYLMFGNDIHPISGFLPSTVAALQNAGLSLSAPNIPIGSQVLSGTGFAFGLTVSGDASGSLFDAGRFHVIYTANAGCEINTSLLRYGSTVSCGSTPGPIGMNGWWITVGLAGWLHAKATLHVDKSSNNYCVIWCGSYDKDFFELKLAVAIQAGFPHPWWATGSASGYGNVCGLEKTLSVNFALGDQCSPTQAPEQTNVTFTQEDAAADQQNSLIQDITPANGADNVPSDAGIEVLFGFVPDTPFDIQEQQANGTPKYRTFKAAYTVTIDSIGVAPCVMCPITQAQSGQAIAIPNMTGNTTGAVQISNAPRLQPGQAAPLSGVNHIGLNHQGVSQPALNQSGLNQAHLAPMPTEIVLYRSTHANILGQYVYFTYSPSHLFVVGQLKPALMDSTKFKLTVTGNLLEFVNNAWQPASKSNGTIVTQTKSRTFSTGLRAVTLASGPGNSQSNGNTLKTH